MAPSVRHFGWYAVLSVCVSGMLAWRTWQEQGQVYSTLLSMSTTKVHLLAFANMVVALTICIGGWMKSFFLGELRGSEQSDLWDNVKYAVLEMLLALTLFREDLSLRFGGLLLLLIFSKSFHWLATSRAGFMETLARPSIKETRRMLLLFLVLFLSDVFLLNTFVANIVHRGFSVILLFASEYLVSLCTICASIGRFFVWRYDLSRTRQMQEKMMTIRMERWHQAAQRRRQLGGENKQKSDGLGEGDNGGDDEDDEFGIEEDIDDIEVPRWGTKDAIMFFMNFTRDLCTSLTYLLCFGVLSFMHGGFPIHMMRELYISFSSLIARLSDLRRYMLVKTKLISLKAEDLEEGATCNICHDSLVDSVKKIPGCGHVYHFHCLVRWLGENPYCPLCKQDVFKMIRQQELAQGLGDPAAEQAQAQSPQEEDDRTEFERRVVEDGGRRLPQRPSNSSGSAAPSSGGTPASPVPPFPTSSSPGPATGSTTSESGVRPSASRPLGGSSFSFGGGSFVRHPLPGASSSTGSFSPGSRKSPGSFHSTPPPMPPFVLPASAAPSSNQRPMQGHLSARAPNLEEGTRACKDGGGDEDVDSLLASLDDELRAVRAQFESSLENLHGKLSQLKAIVRQRHGVLAAPIRQQQGAGPSQEHVAPTS